MKKREGGKINLYQFVLCQPLLLCVSCGFGILKPDLLKNQPRTTEHEDHLVEKGLCLLDIEEFPVDHFTDHHTRGMTA